MIFIRNLITKFNKNNFIRMTMIRILALAVVQLASISILSSQPTDEYGSFYNNGILKNLGASGGYAATGHNFVLNQGLQGTVEAWVYLTQYNENYSYIYEKGSTFAFGVSNSGNQYRPFLNVNTSSFLPVPGTPVPLNRWVHLAATWLQSGGSITVIFYMDGSQVGSPMSSGTGVAGNTDSVTIGGSRISTSSGVIGYVDEVRYWNRQKPADQIARTRFVGIGDGNVANQNSALVSCEDYLGLVSSWNFNNDGDAVADNISLRHAFLRKGAITGATNITGQPIPYNLAAYFPGGANDYIRIPDNNIFDRTVSGTIDGWIYANNGTSTIISKGASPGEMTFRVFLSGGNLSLAIGAFNVTGPPVLLNNWNHIAVTWSFSGAMCTMRFYVNGIMTGPAVNTITMGINSSPVIVGNSQLTNTPFNGYMDELRLWNRALTADEIRAYMFVSAKQGSAFFQSSLLACWNFEGNLNTTTSIVDINGTFNIGVPNKCRLSGYWNENVTGAISGSFVPHPTTINRRDNDNAFPVGYAVRTPQKYLIFNVSTYDTINIPGNVSLTDIEVFLSVHQPYINSTTATLTAPNGQERILLNNNGGPGGSALTFLKDGSPSLSSFNSPWSHLAAPNQALGTFNNTNVQGRWILKITNGAVGYTGRLLGWGLRINNTVSAIQQISNNIPGEYKLYQNYPNPFNPETVIKFDMPKDADVKIIVFDMLGRKVTTLVNEFKQAGSYEINFDASGLSSGMYFYKIETGGFADTKKLLLIK
jgi:subtilisin-like proprotein convertase family protein